MKRIFAIIAAIGTLALPSMAMAKCNASTQTYSRSYSVSCEKGVKIYRHKVLSSQPRINAAPEKYRKTNSASLRQKAVAQQLQAQSIALASRRQAAIDSERVRARRYANRRGPYSRRYVSYGGRGIPRGHFRSARVYP